MFEEYPDILSAGEALEALRVGENSLYRLLNSGKLKAYKNGRNWLIPKEALRQFVRGQAKLMQIAAPGKQNTIYRAPESKHTCITRYFDIRMKYVIME